MHMSLMNSQTVSFTVGKAEAWFSLAIIACALLVTVGTFGGAVWIAAVA